MKFVPKSNKNTKKKAAEEPYLSPEEDDDSSTWEWFDFPEKSAPVQFCNNSSLHGLQYLGQKNRHLCERLFWLTAIIAAVVTATLLIRNMLKSYAEMPIVTVFNPSELTLHEIPFPGVTICNVNNIQSSKVDALKEKAKQGMAGNLTEKEYIEILAKFLDIYHICQSAQSFSDKFVSDWKFGDDIDEIIMNKSSELEHLLKPHHTLREYSQSCEEMILFCVWKDGVENCSKLFTEVDTDYGYCCTFNTMPVSLLRKNSYDPRDDPETVEEWRQADLNVDKLIFDPEKYEDRKYPYRQNYPGNSAGLSFLVDPDLKNSFCLNMDSEGFVVGLNMPLDFPKMKHNGVAIQPDSEVFISITPEVTMTDANTNQYSLEKRKCYYGTEYPLPNYAQYTASNCMEECLAYKTKKECNCLRYFMPGFGKGEKNETLCKPDQHHCVERVRVDIIKNGLEQTCNTCLATCTEITYHSQTTSLNVKSKLVEKLFRNYSEDSKPQNTAIVHVYFDVDSTYPRLRKEMNTVIDLISSAGGLLGLCMGFSMLSFLEIIYHATIRLFWSSYREKQQKKIRSSGGGFRAQDDAHKIKLTEFNTEKSHGFLGKVFQDGTVDNGKQRQGDVSSNLNISDDIFKTSSVTTGQSKLADYFQTNFGTDFQSTRVPRAWENGNTGGKIN